MTIAEVREKCKSFLERSKRLEKPPRDILIFGVLLLASSLSFGLGYLTGLGAGSDSQEINIQKITTPSPTGEEIIASKSGIRYYFSWCGGVNRISEGNKIYFVSVEEAESAGYTLATNCSPR